jgi:Asp-tRNA(Asn)/Glu-tRNA(Gln) amidotransferase A subunit family amidase
VARLKSAGAILLGNTNTPENLMSYETTNALQGHTSNPWNLAHSAGGSSGGEAAAIAAGCSVAGVGSDGGGSIRVPAHFCGICGLKPTPGRVPATGHFPSGDGAFSWLGVVGPMARTVADVRALFDVLRGPEPGDALSAPIAAQKLIREDLRGMRIGVLESNALGAHTQDTSAAVQNAAIALTECGFQVEIFQLPELYRALELWWFFFGPTVAHLFAPSITQENELLLSPQFREYLAVAKSDPAPTLHTLLASCAQRDRLRASILHRMDSVPILLSPVSNATAFRHNEGTWRGPTGYRETMRPAQWLNLAGFPAISIPMQFSQAGLPIGVQLIARPNEEELLLEVAVLLEQARGAWPNPKI